MKQLGRPVVSSNCPTFDQGNTHSGFFDNIQDFLTTALAASASCNLANTYAPTTGRTRHYLRKVAKTRRAQLPVTTAHSVGELRSARRL